MIVHARVHVEVFLFSIGPVAGCRKTYTLHHPSRLLAYFPIEQHPTLSITEAYSYSKFRLPRSVFMQTSTMLQL